MKIPFIIYADMLTCKKQLLVIIILKIHQQLKEISTQLLAIHHLCIVHLMPQKSSMIIIIIIMLLWR